MPLWLRQSGPHSPPSLLTTLVPLLLLQHIRYVPTLGLLLQPGPSAKCILAQTCIWMNDAFTSFKSSFKSHLQMIPSLARYFPDLVPQRACPLLLYIFFLRDSVSFNIPFTYFLHLVPLFGRKLT